MICNYCGEKVERLDSRVLKGLQPMHYECEARSLFGSVAHQKGECSCYGGTGEDDPTLTKRQAAFAALLYALSGIDDVLWVKRKWGLENP